MWSAASECHSVTSLMTTVHLFLKGLVMHLLLLCCKWSLFWEYTWSSSICSFSSLPHLQVIFINCFMTLVLSVLCKVIPNILAALNIEAFRSKYFCFGRNSIFCIIILSDSVDSYFYIFLSFFFFLFFLYYSLLSRNSCRVLAKCSL